MGFPGLNDISPGRPLADDQLPPPQPSDVDESGNLPESAPGKENKLPEQPAPEPTAPEDLGKVGSCILY